MGNWFWLIYGYKPSLLQSGIVTKWPCYKVVVLQTVPVFLRREILHLFSFECSEDTSYKVAWLQSDRLQSERLQSDYFQNSILLQSAVFPNSKALLRGNNGFQTSKTEFNRNHKYGRME